MLHNARSKTFKRYLFRVLSAGEFVWYRDYVIIKENLSVMISLCLQSSNFYNKYIMNIAQLQHDLYMHARRNDLEHYLKQY